MRAGPTNGRRRPGATAVEMAVAFSVFIMFMFAIIEYGRFIMLRQVLEHATREGARRGSVATDEAVIRAQVIASLGSQRGALNVDDADISVTAKDPGTYTDKTFNTAGFGDMIVVQTTATYQPLLPTFGFLPNTVTLQSTAIMRCETNN